MLLGIYGMFALGKTYFTRNTMDEWPELLRGPGLTVVIADQAEEYHYEPSDDVWIAVKDTKGLWNGKKEQKIPHIAEMIEDRDTLWIVESARYFGGLHPEFIDSFRRNKGGLRFIIPWTSEAAGRKFLIERCAKHNKTFREDYWVHDRLEYEVKKRYTNVMAKYKAAGVRCMDFEIDYARTYWSKVNAIMKIWVAKTEADWYAR
jgi:hypothetical protein